MKKHHTDNIVSYYDRKEKFINVVQNNAVTYWI